MGGGLPGGGGGALPDLSEDRKLGKWNLAFGFGQTASEACPGLPIPYTTIRPQGGCRAGLGPSPSLPPSSLAQAWSVLANRHKELRLSGPEGGLRHSLSPAGAQPCRLRRPGKAHSLLFRHLLPHPAEPPRPPSSEPGASRDCFCFRLPLEARADGQAGGAGPQP